MISKTNKKNTNAKNKIIDAFWKLLEIHDYSEITIKALSIEAKVNHNTIYYHFENIDEVALTAFNHTIIDDLPELFLSIMTTDNKIKVEEILKNEDLFNRFKKIRLFARGDSAFLYKIVKDTIMEKWLNAINVKKSDLDDVDLTDLEFIFNGITTLIANPIVLDKTEILSTIVHRPLGQGMLATIANIKEKYEEA